MHSRIIGCRTEKPDFTGLVGFFQRVRNLLVADLSSLFTDRQAGRFWKPFLYLSFLTFIVMLFASNHLPRRLFLLRPTVQPAPPAKPSSEPEAPPAPGPAPARTI